MKKSDYDEVLFAITIHTLNRFNIIFEVVFSFSTKLPDSHLLLINLFFCHVHKSTYRKTLESFFLFYLFIACSCLSIFPKSKYIAVLTSALFFVCSKHQVLLIHPCLRFFIHFIYKRR